MSQLPDDHDRMFMDGTAHPEPILDYHWCALASFS